MSKARGAKPIAPAEPASTALDGELLTERNQQIAAMNQHQQTVIDEFGDGLSYARDLYIAESRRDIRQAAEAAVRVGRRLIVMKAHEAHGDWLTCIEQIGIDVRTAQRMMEAARRLGSLPNAAVSPHLLEAVKGQGKLFELLLLPEDQFAELATEGATGDLSVDDIATMTVRELRTAIRDARADIDAKDERAAKREREIERLQKELRKAKGEAARATVDESLAQLRERAQSAALQVSVDIGMNAGEVEADTLAFRMAALVDHAEGGDQHHDYLGGLIGSLLGDLRRLRDAFGLPIVNDHGAPDWVQGA